jgi:hypothetical protein
VVDTAHLNWDWARAQRLVVERGATRSHATCTRIGRPLTAQARNAPPKNGRLRVGVGRISPTCAHASRR